MPLATIQASNLSTDQKKRIGEALISAFHREGIPGTSVVVLFKAEDADIIAGEAFFEATTPAQVAEPAIVAAAATFYASEAPAAKEPLSSEDFKTRARRTKNELTDLKGQLMQKLQLQGSLSSFQAQDELGLKDCDWAPATLRRLFSELEEEGLIVKQGQKRGTKYVWQGITSQKAANTPKLVKKDEAAEGEE